IADCYGVNEEVLDDLDYLKRLLVMSIKMTGAHILDDVDYEFRPNGVTALFLLSESHCSIHTYPDKGYASIDMYTCGENIDTKLGVDFLFRVLAPTRVNGVMIERGNIDGLLSSPYFYPRGE